jgi:hypothetical protein
MYILGRNAAAFWDQRNRNGGDTLGINPPGKACHVWQREALRLCSLKATTRPTYLPKVGFKD